MMRKLVLGTMLFLGTGPAMAQFGALGPDLQVNTYTTGNQTNAKVGPDGAGGFVVVWQSQGSLQGDILNLSVQGQRYTAAGDRLGAEFQVNTYITSVQYRPAISLDGAGGAERGPEPDGNPPLRRGRAHRDRHGDTDGDHAGDRPRSGLGRRSAGAAGVAAGAGGGPEIPQFFRTGPLNSFSEDLQAKQHFCPGEAVEVRSL